MAMTAQGPHDQADAENVISGALKSVFALSEAYPDLKANTNFLNLQEEPSGTEGRIAYARQFYNDTVYRYHTKITKYPANTIAQPFPYTTWEYFEAAGHSSRPDDARCGSSLRLDTVGTNPPPPAPPPP